MFFDIKEEQVAKNLYTDLIITSTASDFKSVNKRYSALKGYIGDMAGDRSVVVLDTFNEEIVYEETLESDTAGGGISDDGGTLLFTEMQPPYVSVINTGDGTVISDAGSSDITWPVEIGAMNKEGTKAIIFWNSLVKFFDTSDFSLNSELSGEYPADTPSQAVVTKDNIAIVLAGTEISAYDLETETRLWNTDYSSSWQGLMAIDVNVEGTKIFVVTDPAEDYHLLLDTTDGSIINENIPNDYSLTEITDDYGASNYKAFFNQNNDRYVAVKGLHSNESGVNNNKNSVQILDLENNEIMAEIVESDLDAGDVDDIKYYPIGFSNDGALFNIIKSDNTEGLDPSTNDILYVQSRQLMPVSNVLYMKTSEGTVVNSDSNYCISQLDIGTVYQTLSSDIKEITIVNGTNLTLSSIDVGSPNNITFGTSEENFEDLETLTLSDGYAPDAEITIYFKVATTIDSALGESSVGITLQGNE